MLELTARQVAELILRHRYCFDVMRAGRDAPVNDKKADFTRFFPDRQTPQDSSEIEGYLEGLIDRYSGRLFIKNYRWAKGANPKQTGTNGVTKQAHHTIELTRPTAAEPTQKQGNMFSDIQQPQPSSTPAAYQPQPSAGLDGMAQYLLSEKDKQLQEAKEQVKLLSNEVRALEKENAALEKQNFKLETTKENELQRQALSQKTGLSGLSDAIRDNSDLIKEVIPGIFGGIKQVAGNAIQSSGLLSHVEDPQVVQTWQHILQQFGNVSIEQMEIIYLLIAKTVSDPEYATQLANTIKPAQ